MTEPTVSDVRDLTLYTQSDTRADGHTTTTLPHFPRSYRSHAIASDVAVFPVPADSCSITLGSDRMTLNARLW